MGETRKTRDRLARVHRLADAEVPQVLDILKELEAYKPHPEDIYRLADGTRIPRRELAERGIVFVNEVGGFAEKRPFGIMLEGTDYSGQALLQPADLDRFRRLDAAELVPLLKRGLMLPEILEFMGDGLYRLDIAARIAPRELQEAGVFNRDFFKQRLEGALCPLVDCGYVIALNPDFVLPDPVDKKKGIRINEVSRHLAMHGLSERGGQDGAMFSQRYGTIAEFGGWLLEERERK